MGWNGSDSSKGAASRVDATSSSRQNKTSSISPAVVKGALGGLAVVVAALAAFFVFRGGEEKPKAKSEKKPAAIKEVTPAPAPKAAEEPKKPVDPKEDYDHALCERGEDGVLRYKNSLCRAPDPTRKTGKMIDISSRERRVFSNHCERAIASLLTFTPSGRMFRCPDYSDPDFEESFREAIATPIHINPDDSPSDKSLKQAVSDVKKELAQRIGNGEKLADILNEAKKELDRLGAYKKNLTTQVNQLIEDGELSNNDVKDLVAAANQMFEKEGLNPVDPDEFVTWNLRLTAERNGEDPDAVVEAYEEQQREKAAKSE